MTISNDLKNLIESEKEKMKTANDDWNPGIINPTAKNYHKGCFGGKKTRSKLSRKIRREKGWRD